ncbi:MAG: hypothetical protein ACREAA_04870 [Candidatus Polarisedimenticolia bacterium]
MPHEKCPDCGRVSGSGHEPACPRNDTPADPVGAAEDAMSDAAAAMERAAEWLRIGRLRQLASRVDQLARSARKVEAVLYERR